MRTALGLIVCLPLFSADLAKIKQLEERGQIFELRNELSQQVGTAPESRYYRALIAARFGQEAMAVEGFRKYLATGAEPPSERKAHEEMASAFARLGEYGSAAAEWTQVLRLMSQDDHGRSATENTLSLYDSLRDVPPPTIEFGRDEAAIAKRNPFRSWNVPVEVNGKKGEWTFDTGSNISTITESEAARMGLAIRNAAASVASGHTGKKSALRLAVAHDLKLGSAHLHDVIFLVLSDSALRFGKYQMSGFLGLPAIRALGLVDISARGTVQIQPDQTDASGEPNLFFDGLSVVVQVSHNGRTLQMLLDTGANKSYLFPSFRDALAPEERGMIKSKPVTFGGAGGVVHQMDDILPVIQLRIAGKDVKLRNVTLRHEQPTGADADLSGLIAADALTNGFTLDFKAMRLGLD